MAVLIIGEHPDDVECGVGGIAALMGFLGACSPETLDLGDCALEDSLENRHRGASVIRAHRPRIVLAPFWEDLHNECIVAAHRNSGPVQRLGQMGDADRGSV
jgi:hypothetical protein